MNQNEVASKVYERIANKVGDWFSDLTGADDKELLKASAMFRRLYNAVGFQYEYNKMETPDDMNEVYKVLEEILKELQFDEVEIEELMSLVKNLDKEHLKKLLHSLEREFYRASRDIIDYLEEEVEAYNE